MCRGELLVSGRADSILHEQFNTLCPHTNRHTATLPPSTPVFLQHMPTETSAMSMRIIKGYWLRRLMLKDPTHKISCRVESEKLVRKSCQSARAHLPVPVLG